MARTKLQIAIEMSDNRKSKEKEVEKKTACEDAISALNTITGNVSLANSSLQSALSSFQSGGYVIDGEALRQTEITDLEGKCEEIIDDANALIEKTNLKIDDYQNKIDKLDKIYEKLKIEYNNAEV